MRNRRRATIVHLNAIAKATPLQGGYLKTYAEAEPSVASEWEIELYSRDIGHGAIRVIEELVERKPAIAAFSCYVWNTGIVRRILPVLRGLLPETTFLLGGVQVMNHARRYVAPEWENVLTCNGEGEMTFRRLLLELGERAPDLSRVGGLTFQRDGVHHTTEPYPRLRELDTIPSPWLKGVFGPNDLGFTIFETNRGCPYQCEYCYWGGAIGQRVHRIAGDRIKDELSWISKNGARVLHICDANFGIFEDDLAIAEHLVQEYERHRRPGRVNFSTAKNQPRYVGQITQMLTKAGMCTAHCVAIQTTNDNALRLAKRKNIKTDNYITLQKTLNSSGIASFLEMIWPMPGETLTSFENGIEDLCARGAQSFIIYPLLLINNVGYAARREELGLVTIAEEDPASDAEIVVQTRDVSFADFKNGLEYGIGIILLYNMRALYTTLHLWKTLQIVTIREAIRAFTKWLVARPADPLAAIVLDGMRQFEKLSHYRLGGRIIETFIHTERKRSNELLLEFAQDHPEWFPAEHAALLRSSVEFDILARPFAYHNTAFELGVKLDHLKIVEDRTIRREWVVASEFDFRGIRGRLERGERLTPDDLQPSASQVAIGHRRAQILRPADEDPALDYCYNLSREVGLFIPALSAEPRRTELPSVG